MTGAPAPAGVWSHWQCLGVSADRTPQFLAGVRSDRHPNGVRVELLAEAALAEIGDDAVSVLRFGASGEPVGLEVTPLAAPKAPPLWFAELRESTNQPPATNLVAFTGHGIDAGRLLDEAALAGVDVATDDQVGAVRWYPATGEVDQIYVTPSWRRHTVAQALLFAAASLAAAHDWPRLWGDGQRTEQGEQLRNASGWRHRAADLTHVAPPMTPGGTPGELPGRVGQMPDGAPAGAMGEPAARPDL